MNQRSAQSILCIIPYFGRFPDWIDLFLETCRYNPSMNWVIITDCTIPDRIPPNVRFVPMQWSECIRHIEKKLDIPFKPAAPYKLCDLKFAYGWIFAELALGYDFVAFGDIDVMYGNIREFLSPSILDHDLITFNATHISGHFTLLRNTGRIITCYQQCEGWRQAVAEPEYVGMDENRGHYGIKHAYATESFNSPLSPYIPWHDGTFEFPAAWFWRAGKLTNSLDGPRGFPYLHFMRYKYLWRTRQLASTTHVDPCNAPHGWKVCPGGIYPCGPGETDQVSPDRIPVARAL